MKVLVIAPYFYSSYDSDFQKNNSGLGISIESSTNELGKNNEVYILVNRFIRQKKYETFIVLKHTFFSFFSGIKAKYLFKAFTMFFKKDSSFSYKIHLFFQTLNQGFIERQIKKIKPDIVQLHSICVNSSLSAHYCEKNNVSFVLTLHGIISNPSISAPLFLKQEEGLLSIFISNSQNGLITCVSSGTKKIIVEKYGANKNRIYVTPNGIKNDCACFNFYDLEAIKKENKISGNKYVIMCSGNVSENKNQIQLLDAISLLPKSIQSRIVVLLAGEFLDNRIKEKIENYSNFDLRILGFIERKKLFGLYAISDLNALMSISEGFGFSVIEAYQFGVPSIFFYDIDAANDLFCQDACILMNRRNNEYIKNIIVEAINKKWDNNKIKSFGKNFLLSETIKKYIDVYNKCAKRLF